MKIKILRNINDPIYFPDFIQVIEEVTESVEYKNAALAKKKDFLIGNLF